MAKKTTKKRSALGDQLDPVAVALGDRGGDLKMIREATTAARKAGRKAAGSAVAPTAFRLDLETMTALRAAAYTLQRTAASIVEDALREHLAKLEKAHGPFPRPRA